MSKTTKIVLLVVLIAILIVGYVYRDVFMFKNNSVPNNSGNTSISTTTVKNNNKGIDYTNEDYGFRISLPNSWKGFSVVVDSWEGYSLENNGNSQRITENGPLISVRHPDWEYKSPRQDIPVMVFTISQWNDLTADKFHIGASPINPSELGRNSKYVFALPARYNFSYLTGYEEVDQIIRSDAFKAF